LISGDAEQVAKAQVFSSQQCGAGGFGSYQRGACFFKGVKVVNKSTKMLVCCKEKELVMLQPLKNGVRLDKKSVFSKEPGFNQNWDKPLNIEFYRGLWE